MNRSRPHIRWAVLSAAALFVVAFGLPRAASAGMYKYRKSDGSVLVTTEPRPSLELVEVISGAPPGGGSSSSNNSSDTTEANGDDEDHENRERARRARERHQSSASPPREPEDRNGPLRRDRFDDLIREASEAYDVPFPFIKAVIRVESDFKSDAISSAGAMGLMQLMPATAEMLNVTDPFEPRQNVFGGTKLLRTLIDRYDGDINLILSAYNAGGGAVAEYDGIPYRKTRQYVASVYRWYEYYSRRQQEESE